MADMRGKVVVITGATSGIGAVAGEQLAAMGARIVLVARDPRRAEAELARLREKNQQVQHSVHYADLSRFGEMKRVGGEIASAEPRIDILINNAGALFGERIVTPDGLEMTFATNHMSYFVLTEMLRERLIASAPSRVINTSSDAHRRGRLDFTDLQSAKDYRGFPVYGRSKLCNILYTRELARRLAGTGVTANSLHPGFVATRFGDNSGGAVSRLIRIAKVFALTPEQGAETIVYLASSPDVANVTGQYFVKCRVKQPTREAQDDDAARRLWEESARLAGMAA
ncbi:MAG TPA: SDR family oxidoreductase [Bryobacteraceae bacterium]|nr:SDR family oxidoreductase [Bryobacteraceae bacterium]